MTAKNISQIDFDTLKDSFKNFLKTQDQFSDYNFEGSNFNVLLNLLAYNTYYNAFYQNMAISEVFLDSAVKRGSIVSRAKELGYRPRSTTASEIDVNLVTSNLLPNEIAPSMTLSRGTRFRGIDATNSQSYYFVVTESISANINNNSFTFSNVKLKEGTLLTYNFQVNTTDNPNLIFEIPHDNVDTTTLRVRVQESIGSQNIETYVIADNVYDIDGNSKVYFLQENYRGKFELQFGDGVLGKTLVTGNIILVDYIVTNGAAANGINRLIGVDPVGLVSIDRIIISILNNSTGGADKETNESIRLNSPIYHIAKGRATTSNDYTAFLKNKFSFIEAINTWGGEDNDPPLYGKICICIKPYDGLFLSDYLKFKIISPELKKSAVVSIIPEFVDPEFKYVSVITDILYDETKTINSGNTIKNLALTKIDNYFAKVSKKFNQKFSKSSLLKDLLTIDDSIESINTELYITIKKLIIPGATQGIEFTFNNEIVPYSFSSNLLQIEVNQVAYNVFIKDKSTNYKTENGILNIVDSANKIIVDNIGTINYLTGNVVINNTLYLNTNTADNNILFGAKSVNDIDINNNQLIIKDETLYGKYDGIISGIKVSVSQV